MFCIWLGRVAKWLAHRTPNHMIVGSSLTGASNILGQDMNLVDAPQCCLSLFKAKKAEASYNAFGIISATNLIFLPF